MFQAALLTVALLTAPIALATSDRTSIQQCLGAMDGAVYHGDPSDRTLMKSNVTACEHGVAVLDRTRPTPAQGPEKLFLTGRILDRAATLSYIGLDDATTAFREVKTANLFFRIAAGLPNASADYHAAALANLQLTTLQLHTLRADIAARDLLRTRLVALHARRPHTTAYTP